MGPLWSHFSLALNLQRVLMPHRRQYKRYAVTIKILFLLIIYTKEQKCTQTQKPRTGSQTERLFNHDDRVSASAAAHRKPISTQQAPG